MAKEHIIEGKIVFGVDTDTATSKVKKFVDDIQQQTARANSSEGILLRDNLAQLRVKLADLRKEMRGLTEYNERVAMQSQIEGVSKEVTQANRELTNFIRTGDKAQSVLGKNFESIGGGAKNMGITILQSLGVFELLKRSIDFIVSGIKTLVKEVVNLAGNLEQAQISFTTMLENGDRARTLLRDLSKFAKETPFTIPDARQNAKMLLAVGVSADNVIGIMKSLGDVAAGLDIPMSRLSLNLGQIITQGKLTGRELRDFLIAGVPLVDELAKNLGVAKSEISDLVKNGDISADQVIEAFRTMTDEGGRFADLMSKQSRSYKGTISNITDSLIILGETIGNKALPFLKNIQMNIQGLLEGPNDNRLAEEFSKIKTEIDTVNLVLDDTSKRMQQVQDDFDNGAISAGEYQDKMGGLRESMAQSNRELKEAEDNQKRLNEVQEYYNSISDNFSENTKIASDRINELGVQLKELTDKHNAGTISQEEYDKKAKAIVEEVKNLNSVLRKEQIELDKTRILTETLATAGLTATEIKEYMNSLVIENSGDISSLGAEAQAYKKLGDEALLAAKKKLLAENMILSKTNSDKARANSSMSSNIFKGLFNIGKINSNFDDIANNDKKIESNLKLLSSLDDAQKTLSAVSKEADKAGNSSKLLGEELEKTGSKGGSSKKEIDLLAGSTAYYNKKISDAKKELDNLVIGSDDYIAKQKEITDLQTTLNKALGQDLKDSIKEGTESAKDYMKEFDKSIKDTEDSIKSLDKSIKDIEKQLTKLGEDKGKEVDKLSERYAKLTNELNSGKVKAEEMASVLAEIALIEQNTTEGGRAEAIRYSKLSESEKILEKIKGLEQEVVEKQSELEALKLQKDQEKIVLQAFNDERKIMEENYTILVKDQSLLRMEAIQKEIDRAKILINLQRQLARSMSSGGGSSSSITNNNNVNVNVSGGNPSNVTSAIVKKIENFNSGNNK